MTARYKRDQFSVWGQIRCFLHLTHHRLEGNWAGISFIVIICRSQAVPSTYMYVEIFQLYQVVVKQSSSNVVKWLGGFLIGLLNKRHKKIKWDQYHLNQTYTINHNLQLLLPVHWLERKALTSTLENCWEAFSNISSGYKMSLCSFGFTWVWVHLNNRAHSRFHCLW